MERVSQRYPSTPALKLFYFADPDSMRKALMRDLNQTQEKICGTFLG